MGAPARRAAAFYAHYVFFLFPTAVTGPPQPSGPADRAGVGAQTPELSHRRRGRRPAGAVTVSAIPRQCDAGALRQLET
jgi:hypothetical protein